MTHRQPIPLELRFWKHADKNGPGGCWLWVGAKNMEGYGTITNEGSTKRLRAHRVAYELSIGPIPPGLTIDHLCRVRNCVNPQHLEAVSNAVNVLRGDNVVGRNARKTQCIHGHALTPDNVMVRTRADGSRHRRCRECSRAMTRASYRRTYVRVADRKVAAA